MDFFLFCGRRFCGARSVGNLVESSYLFGLMYGTYFKAVYNNAFRCFCSRISYGANAVQPHSGLANRTLKGFNGISPTCNVGKERKIN